jgi:hypothetical protein
MSSINSHGIEVIEVTHWWGCNNGKMVFLSGTDIDGDYMEERFDEYGHLDSFEDNRDKVITPGPVDPDVSWPIATYVTNWNDYSRNHLGPFDFVDRTGEVWKCKSQEEKDNELKMIALMESS